MRNRLSLSLIAIAILPHYAFSSPSECLKKETLKQSQACLVAKGNPLSRVAVDKNGNKVIIESPSFIHGDYANYIDGPDDINSPLLALALKNDRKNLSINATPVSQEMTFGLNLTSADDGRPHNIGALVISNMGPDMSGMDILSWYNKSNLGDGYVLTSSLTHGFSDLKAQSRGGRYETAYLSLEKAHSFGLLSVGYIYSDNKIGGDSIIYELGGVTNRYDLSLKQWITPKISLTSAAEHVRRKQEIGVLGIGEEQSYTAVRPTIAYDSNSISASLMIKKGVSGSREYDYSPLMGTFDPSFWSVTGKASGQAVLIGSKELGILQVAGAFTLFTGTREMPSSERIGLGGQGAGSSHENGVFSGYKGYQYQVGITKPIVNNILPAALSLEANLNGGYITTPTNIDIEIQSIEFGGSIKSNEWSFRLTGSKSINTRNVDDDKRVTGQIVWNY